MVANKLWHGALLALLVCGVQGIVHAQDTALPTSEDTAPSTESFPAPTPLPAPKAHPAASVNPIVTQETYVAPPSGPPAPAIETHGEDAPGGLFFNTDYLLLKAHRRGLDFAIIDPNNRGVPEGSIVNLDWDSRSGVRVGGGYRLPGEGWEIGTYYTYFHTNAEERLSHSATGSLFATLTHPGPVELVDTAAANSSLNYNVVDLEVGRNVNVSDSLALRLFGGGRLAWIDQSLSAFYTGGDATNAMVTSPIDFEGAGLRVGGEGHWNMRYGFSLFARADGSLLVGDFHTHLLETNANGSSVTVNVTDSFRKIVPVLEMGLGVSWQYRNLQASVGYEIINWFNMVDSTDFVSDVHQGKFTHRTSDLNLDGLMVRLGMSF